MHHEEVHGDGKIEKASWKYKQDGEDATHITVAFGNVPHLTRKQKMEKKGEVNRDKVREEELLDNAEKRRRNKAKIERRFVKKKKTRRRGYKQEDEEVDKSTLERALMEKVCLVCVKKPKNVIIQPCGHRALCSNCAESVTACPICSAFIEGTDRYEIE